MLTPDCRLQVSDFRLQIADCRFQVSLLRWQTIISKEVQSLRYVQQDRGWVRELVLVLLVGGYYLVLVGFQDTIQSS